MGECGYLVPQHCASCLVSAFLFLAYQCKSINASFAAREKAIEASLAGKQWDLCLSLAHRTQREGNGEQGVVNNTVQRILKALLTSGKREDLLHASRLQVSPPTPPT